MAGHLQSLLTSDYDVDIARDGRALIEAVEARLPDVIVSDIAMPGASGLTAAKIILAAHPDARIIFITVHEEAVVIRRAMAEGGRGYVTKSDAGDELANAVRTVLDGGQYISSTARVALAGSARRN
jgi:DNA-binding NarL/FixJ family response regulator